MIKAETNNKEYLKFGLLITALLFLAWTFSSLDGDIVPDDFMRWFMGFFFLIFGSFKLFDYEMFVEMFRMYDIPAAKWSWYGWIYPFLEISLGMLFITNALPLPRNLLTLAVMGVGAYGVRQYLSSSQDEIQCACLGNVIKLPLSRVTLIEDVTMGSMAFLLLLPL